MEFDEIVKDLRNIRPKNTKTRDWSRLWEPFMRKYKCDRVCELGVFKGSNFLEMIRHSPEIAVAVDTWNNDGVNSKRDAKYTKEELELQYENFKNLVSSLPFVQILREDTLAASKHFSDNFFDFVYIDADHSFEATYADITNWYPKIKQGRFLLGHDYPRYGVGEAVDKFVKKEKLELITLFPSIWAVVKK